MRSRRMLPFLALLVALPALAGCGGDPPPKPAAGPGATAAGGGGAGPALGRKMPEFTPSGIGEDYKRWLEVKSALKYSKTEDEKVKADKDLAEWVAQFPPKWEGKDVPAPECLIYARLLQECKKYTEAVVQARKYIAVAPDDTSNYVNANTLVICALAQAGDFDGADRELKAIAETVYKGRDGERKVAEDTIANSMYDSGRFEQAAPHFERLATTGFGDLNSAILGVDCYLRAGDLSAAKRLADDSESRNKDGRNATRVKELVQMVGLVGRPAPDFSAARWWKNGGPVTSQQMKGSVTVVFSWNMYAQWMRFFFPRISRVAKDYADKGVQVIGVSRLARFDPARGCTDKTMTDERELEFYDAWVRELEVPFALAVGGYEDESLINAWAGGAVPTFIVVGKDGNVCYARSGKDDKYVNSLREIIDRALLK